jgi:hypothetical protein
MVLNRKTFISDEQRVIKCVNPQCPLFLTEIKDESCLSMIIPRAGNKIVNLHLMP